jgi:ceramide glucosyltransferase
LHVVFQASLANSDCGLIRVCELTERFGLADRPERSPFDWRADKDEGLSAVLADWRRDWCTDAQGGKMMAHLLRSTILILATAPFVYYALAIYCALGHFRDARKTLPPAASFTPPVSILKPVRGLDREAYENFASFCRLDYPEYEILFAVPAREDPATPIIEKLQRDFPRRQIRLLIGSPEVGTNSKVNKLCHLTKEAKYDLLVMSDSDVRIESDCLREMVAPFSQPKVGLVTALFRGMPGRSFASALDALGVPADSAASALVACRLERNMRFAFGWMMAMRKSHLYEVGGFEAIANHHSDDFEIGRRIASKGYRVELMRKYVWMVFPEETVGEFMEHEIRWSVGLRNVRRLGYYGLVLTFGLPWAVLAALVAPTKAVGLAYLVGYFLLRLAMAWTVGVYGIGDPATRRNIWLVPLRDAFSFGFWTAANFTDQVFWRGLRYRVKDGLLIPMPSLSRTLSPELPTNRIPEGAAD